MGASTVIRPEMGTHGSRPNPANPIKVPLVNSWWLSKKKGKEASVHFLLDGQVRYEVMQCRGATW